MATLKTTIRYQKTLRTIVRGVGRQGNKGDTATVAIGSVTTVGPDDPATVTNVGTNTDGVLNFGIPKGDKGDAATIAIGTVNTLLPSQPATVANAGTANDAVLNFGIPKGDKGDKGDQGDVSVPQMNAAIAAYMQPLRPVVLTQPLAASGNVGDSLSISCLGGILPNTHLNLTYQWQLSTDAGVSYSDITGATSATIPFNPALFGQNGLYRCRLTNAFGTENTDAVALTVDNAIRHLYGVNDRGIAWDLDRMDHLFQLNTGGTPVTAYGDPVGLVVGRERGGLDDLGPELVADPNMVRTVFRDDVTNTPIGSGVTVASGTAYVITLNITANTSTVSSSVSINLSGGVWNGSQTLGIAAGRTGVVTFIGTAGATGQVTIYGDNSPTNLTIDFLSIKTIASNRWIQTVNARRMTYARRPKSGVRNLLQRTEEFGNAYWAGTNITQSIATAIHLTATATNFVPTTTNGQHFVSSAVLPVLAGNTYTISVYVKADGYEGVALAFGASRLFANYNLATGTVTNSSSDGINMTGHSASIEAIGSGVFRLRMTGTAITSIPNVYSLRLGVSANPASSVHSGQTFVGDGISGVVFSAPQIEIGPAPTSYQRVTNQFDVTETGQPSINYLWFDGIDDCLVSATAIDFSNSDEMTVCVGQRKLSDASQRTIIGMGAGIDTDNGTIQLTAPNGASTSYAMRSRGTSIATAETTAFAQPDVCVLTGQANISDDLCTLRRNSVQVATSSTDQGSGNFANAVLHVGSRAGSSLFFQGHLNSGFIINRILNPLVLADYEKYWVGVKAGVDL